MKTSFMTLIFTLLIFVGGAFAQTSWMDRPLRNWNTTTNIPNAPRATGDSPTSVQCRDSVRAPESLADRAVTRAGWSLFGAAQVYGGVTLVKAMASVDGMCRPMQYNTFVFVGNRFAGTLSPDPMDSRTDGSLTDATLIDPANITAEFARYTTNDALCCPSQTTAVSYQIARSLVQAQNVSTSASCPTGEPVDPNVVSGTVSFSAERTPLPRLADLTVRLVDITNPNAPPRVIASQTIRLNRQPVPIPFSIRFEERDIAFRNDYAVEAEITARGQVFFKNAVTQRVLTRGNPSKVDLVLVPVTATEPTNEAIVSGTITYRERIALARDAEIRLKLVDVSAGSDAEQTIVEDSFFADGRQVPLPFELRVDQRRINSRSRYVVRAEIYTDSRLAFTTDTEYAVLTRGNPTSNIVMTLTPAGEETPETVTGKNIDISKLGAGSFSLEGRSDRFLVRGTVRVQTDGKAEVVLSPIGSTISFSGNLIYADDTTLRIKVTNSGNADASGEIEIRYSGRNLNSINSKDLVLDGQKASIIF